MGINFNKEFNELEKTFEDLYSLNLTFLSNITNKNKQELLKKISDLRKNTSAYKITIKNMYIKGD